MHVSGWLCGWAGRCPVLTSCLPDPLQLRELEDKYAECMEMLHEAQEELKNLRNKTVPNTTSRRYHSLGLFPMVRAAAAGGHPVPTQRRAGVEPGGGRAASHFAAWIGFELRAPEPSRQPLSHVRQTGSSLSIPLTLTFSPPALTREILVGTSWSRNLSCWEGVIYP